MWDENDWKRPSLSSQHANDVLSDVIDLFRRQRSSQDPKRIVVHKSSPFTDEEKLGFNHAVKDIEIVDYCHVKANCGIMAFPEKEKFPPIRGTYIFDDNNFLLYTSGYVSLSKTYLGGSTPNPILIKAERLDSTPEQIGIDMMSLTKLDWNNANLYTRLPVTVSVSKKVGLILSESKARDLDNFPSNYRFYM